MKGNINLKEKAKAILSHPEALGWALGYKDFTSELHGEWIRKMVTTQEDMTLQAHRGSFKTTCLCVAIAMMMIENGDRTIMFMRKTDNDVAEVINNVLRIVNAPIFKDIYRALTGMELMVVRANSTSITLNNFTAPIGASQLRGLGINGSLTGKHADLIITDDIVNLKDRTSRAEREHTKAIYMELQNIKNRGGRILNTGTPWHKEDAFMLMPKPLKYDCYHTGMISKEKMEQLRQSMSPSLFAANYELQHIATENALFTTPPVFTSDPTLLRDGIAHIDAAYGGEDYTAFTCGKRVGDKLYMYGRMWQKHVDTVLDVCVAESQRLMCGPIWCEDNADKGFLAREIKKTYGYKTVTYTEHENKYVKISSFLRKWWTNIVWLEGTDPQYLDQIMDYTDDAEHDDAPDSASVICRHYNNKRGTTYVSPFGN